MNKAVRLLSFFFATVVLLANFSWSMDLNFRKTLDSLEKKKLENKDKIFDKHKNLKNRSSKKKVDEKIYIIQSYGEPLLEATTVKIFVEKNQKVNEEDFIEVTSDKKLAMGTTAEIIVIKNNKRVDKKKHSVEILIDGKLINTALIKFIVKKDQESKKMYIIRTNGEPLETAANIKLIVNNFKKLDAENSIEIETNGEPLATATSLKIIIKKNQNVDKKKDLRNQGGDNVIALEKFINILVDKELIELPLDPSSKTIDKKYPISKYQKTRTLLFRKAYNDCVDELQGTPALSSVVLWLGMWLKNGNCYIDNAAYIPVNYDARLKRFANLACLKKLVYCAPSNIKLTKFKPGFWCLQEWQWSPQDFECPYDFNQYLAKKNIEIILLVRGGKDDNHTSHVVQVPGLGYFFPRGHKTAKHLLEFTEERSCMSLPDALDNFVKNGAKRKRYIKVPPNEIALNALTKQLTQKENPKKNTYIEAEKLHILSLKDVNPLDPPQINTAHVDTAHADTAHFDNVYVDTFQDDITHVTSDDTISYIDPSAKDSFICE